VEGVSLPNQRSNRVVLEANRNYWDKERFPRLKRIVFDNTLDQKEAVELVKNGEGLVDLVTGLSPLETLQVARSPFAKVVKARGSLGTIFGRFNMRKVRSPWHDIRLRHAANVAINRTNLIRYAAKGNGVIVPALVPVQGFGYDPNLAPYPFDPDKARHLLREAGYPEGLAITLIASEELTVQATVVSKMLEHVGFQVRLQILDSATFSRKTLLSRLDQPPEQQSWDIALGTFLDIQNFPAYLFYNYFALDGQDDWVAEQPELRQLYEQILGTVNEGQQVALTRRMERHTRDQAYFLFLYNPIHLYAVNKEVKFVPYLNMLNLSETSVTEQHWSVRKQKASVQK
jgi:peptide/nickel transport system substrate-binding protein